MKVHVGGEAERVRQSAQHRVYVEGSHDEAIDPIVIKELLRNNGLTQIDVLPMGACDNVRSAAQALIHDHPSYYFLIDRDDQDHETVDLSWNNFPNPDTHNMVIWRKRELENYFIAPDYIERSSFLSVPIENVRQRILDECNRRIFLDAANLTLAALKRGIRKQFPSDFGDPAQFQTEADGARQLETSPGLEEHRKLVADLFEKNVVNRIYSGFVLELSDSRLPLEYGSGTWLERMSGKEIFHCIAGPCFRVEAADGTILQGKVQNNEIAKALLALPLDQQPEDFQHLFRLLRARVKSNS